MQGDDVSEARAGGATLEALMALLRDGARARQRHPVGIAVLDRQHPFTLALRDPDRAAAVQALAAIGADAVPHLINALDSAPLAVRAALLALEKIGDARAVPAIGSGLSGGPSPGDVPGAGGGFELRSTARSTGSTPRYAGRRRHSGSVDSR